MFIGSYEYSLDDKSRLTIPSKFRNEISGKLYLMKGYDGCLSIYKEDDFNKTLAELQKLQFQKEKSRLHLRVLLETVVELTLDKSNRIQIPVKTIQKYNIGKNVKIIGLIDHFEVWDSKIWEEYQDLHEKDFEKDAEDLLNNEI
ncbi:MAG: division/cell wall cluster transcriptional repressor MraZ [Bacillales bacterium]